MFILEFAICRVEEGMNPSKVPRAISEEKLGTSSLRTGKSKAETDFPKVLSNTE